MNLHTELSGRYKLVVRKLSDIDESVTELEFPNIITDIGLDRWGVGAIGNRCMIGSGNATPSVSDTGLGAQLAVTSSRVALTTWRTYSAAERWTEVTICYRFTPGVVLNSISEVCIGWDTGIWSRALIRDGGGNPTTIQLLADEVLDVYYTMRMQFPAADVTGSITLDGVAYDWVMRPANIHNTPNEATNWFLYSYGGYSSGIYGCYASSSALAGVDGSPSAHSMCNSTTPSAYASGTKKQRIEYVFGLDSANFGIKSIVPQPAGMQYSTVSWQLGFYQGGVSVGVPKTSTKRLSLTFDFSWGRA